jgi:hypothetical protein
MVPADDFVDLKKTCNITKAFHLGEESLDSNKSPGIIRMRHLRSDVDCYDRYEYTFIYTYDEHTPPKQMKSNIDTVKQHGGSCWWDWSERAPPRFPEGEMVECWKPRTGKDTKALG